MTVNLEDELAEIADIIPEKQLSDLIEPMRELATPLWERMHSPLWLLEVGSAVTIAAIAYFFQQWLWHRFTNRFPDKKRKAQVAAALLSCAAPFIAFCLYIPAMVIASGFSDNLYPFELAIKLTMVWFVWLLIIRTVTEPLVRYVLCITLLPILILSAWGYATAVIAYLDSLGVALGGVHLSLFLFLKGMLLVTCLAWIGKALSHSITAHIRHQEAVNEGTRELLIKIFQMALYAAIVLLALNILGIDLTIFALFGGAIGVGIGFGLQKIAANFISGIILLLEGNIKIGHLVELEGGCYGWIRQLGGRATVIEGVDGREVLVPNEELIGKSLINWTFSNTRGRIELPLCISYQNDLVKAKQLMLEVAQNYGHAASVPAASCYLSRFGDSGAEFLLYVWVEDMHRGRQAAQSELLLALWERFKEEGIVIPNRQCDVHLY